MLASTRLSQKPSLLTGILLNFESKRIYSRPESKRDKVGGREPSLTSIAVQIDQDWPLLPIPHTGATRTGASLLLSQSILFISLG